MRDPRIQLDPCAPRPTLKTHFNWDPFPNTLCITKLMGEKRQAKWLGLRNRAHGLAQSHARAFPLNIVGSVGPVDLEIEQAQDHSELEVEKDPESSSPRSCSLTVDIQGVSSDESFRLPTYPMRCFLRNFRGTKLRRPRYGWTWHQRSKNLRPSRSHLSV